MSKAEKVCSFLKRRTKKLFRPADTKAQQKKDKSVVCPQALRTMSCDRQRELLAGPQDMAFPWVRMAAEHGVQEAQLRLGRMLLEGAGCIQDQSRALDWFMTAARDGNAEAMNMVGRCLENGWGAAPDAKAAASWFTRAAERGEPWAQYNLGHLLLDGNGVVRDHAAAFTWYTRAAAQGHERAMNIVARCMEHGWGTQRDPVSAEHWYRRSAEGGYFRGQYNYATILLAQGEHASARLWLNQAGEKATPPVAQHIHSLLSKLTENAVDKTKESGFVFRMTALSNLPENQ